MRLPQESERSRGEHRTGNRVFSETSSQSLELHRPEGDSGAERTGIPVDFSAELEADLRLNAVALGELPSAVMGDSPNWQIRFNARSAANFAVMAIQDLRATCGDRPAVEAALRFSYFASMRILALTESEAADPVFEATEGRR